MSWLTLEEIASMTHGVLYGDNRAVEGVGIDTRTLRAGELFVALAGEHCDGHDFVAALDAQAAGALVEHRVGGTTPQIVVGDVLAGLADFAAAWRGRCNPATIALTGSNGKTTTKTMLASVLGRRFNVLVTPGNFNNRIGVPLTLLALREEHEAAVVELGANHPGEIAALGRLVRPSVALVLNAGPAHLEGFGNLDGVARAKGELFECLGEDGVGVVNADDAYCDYWLGLLEHRRVVTFAVERDADVRGRTLPDGAEITVEGRTRRLNLALLGRHNLYNALAAAAAAHALGVEFDDVVAGLEAVEAAPGRLRLIAGIAGARAGMRLIDDSYNANPGSLAAAVAVLCEYPGERWLVLGDMAELGADAERLHFEAGRNAARRGVSCLFTLGALSRAAAEGFGAGAGGSSAAGAGSSAAGVGSSAAGAEAFDSCEALCERLASLLDEVGEEVTVLVKGSRSARMERVVHALEAPRGEVRAC